MKPPLPKVVMIDANVLVALLDPATAPDDKARLNHFMTQLEKTKSKLVIPMPAVAEYLVGADIAGVESFAVLERKANIAVCPFDRAAAFECAQMDRAARNAGDKKDGTVANWQKVKIDRQIVSIGKAHGATLVISEDSGVRNNGLRVGMTPMKIQELDLPESARQGKLALVEPPPPRRIRLSKRTGDQ